MSRANTPRNEDHNLDTMFMNKKLMMIAFGLAVAAGLWLAVPSAMAKTKERHPKIHAAITALEAAKTDMQAAAHDFGGHRVAALASCDEAIKQLQLALQYDQK
jgi:F0F1-type ATP synthase membrane subunit b/b'